MKRLGLALAFAGTMIGSSLLTAVVLREGASRAQPAPAPAPAPAPTPAPTVITTPAPEPAFDYVISAYFDDAKNPSNGFVVLNRKNGKVANCIANWQGKAEGKCRTWDWVKLP